MSHRLLNQTSNMLAALPVAFETQDEEFLYPYYRLQEYGFEVDVIGCGNKPFKGKYGIPFPVNISSKEALDKVNQYDLIIIPGGVGGAEIIRMDKNILILIQSMNTQGKIISAICHGIWPMISANIMKNKQATCYPGMKDDLINCGAFYLEQPIVIDGNLVTSPHYKYNGEFMKWTLNIYERNKQMV